MKRYPALRFGGNTDTTAERLIVTTPDSLLHKLEDKDPDFHDTFAWGVKARVLGFRAEDDGYHSIQIHTERIGRKSAEFRKKATKAAAFTLSRLTEAADLEDSQDPKLRLYIGTERLARRRLGMSAKIIKPLHLKDSLPVSIAAHMRQVAGELRYQAPESRQKNYDDIISVTCNFSEGISLLVDSKREAGVFAEEIDFKNYTAINMYANNLTSPTQQLICLAGLSTLAHYCALD